MRLNKKSFPGFMMWLKMLLKGLFKILGLRSKTILITKKEKENPG